MIEDDNGIFEISKIKGEKYELEFFGVQNFRNITEEFTEIKPHLVIMDIGLPFKEGSVTIKTENSEIDKGTTVKLDLSQKLYS